MSLQPLEARDEILTRFKETWDEGDVVNGIDTEDYPVEWPDVPFTIPNTQTPWIRVRIQTIDGGQQTLADHQGGRKFNREGFITVQIFVPVAGYTELLYRLTRVVMNAFEGKATPGGIWFRRVRYVEAGVYRSWNQINVIADFNYDEVK